MSARSTQHASRITHHASRITHHASRITHHAINFHPLSVFATTAVFGSHRQPVPASKSSQIHTRNSGSDWIGYVYPNTNGNVPAIN